jgi:hypothetical protein
MPVSGRATFGYLPLEATMKLAFLPATVAALALTACSTDLSSGAGGAGLGDAGSGGLDGGTTTYTTCVDPGPPAATIALGGTPSTPDMVLLTRSPGPTCANQNTSGVGCCSHESRQLTLTPEQQTVGVHVLDPSACTSEWLTYYQQGSCYAWTSQSTSCDPIGAETISIEVISIDATQITLKEAIAGADADAGLSWSSAYTVPRCP